MTLRRWLFPPDPLARIAWLRAAIYAFVILDAFVFTPWVRAHGDVPTQLYQPVFVARLLHLPAPTPSVVAVVEVALIVSAVVAAAGRLPRGAGAVAFLAYGEWMIIAMSYGKVDHDRFALLVTLAVLPTVGRARFGDLTPSWRAGFALRTVQIAVVCTYFLAAWAKVRFGGWGWVNGETFYWAMSRRGTPLGSALLHAPWLLHVFQWGVFCAEMASPLLLFGLRGRFRYAGVVFFLGFHLATELCLSIHFLPLVVCLLAFLPLERLESLRPRRREVGVVAPPATAAGPHVPGVAIRSVALAGCLGVLVAGTVAWQDDAFPFGPFSMYAFTVQPAGDIVSTTVQADTDDGRRVAVDLDTGGVGMRRAEIEGQLSRMKRHPDLLGAMSRAHHRLHPKAARYRAVYIVQSTTRLRDGVAAGTVTTVVASWRAP